MKQIPSTAIAIAGFVVVLLLLPLLGSAFIETLMSMAGLFAIVAIGLNLLVGFAGKISFGHNAFMALGAYTSAIMTTRYGWSPVAALTAGAIGTALVALVIGATILRLRGHYLAMVTLALGQITISVSTRWTEVTGGLTGIPGVPDFAIAGFVFSSKTSIYYLIWSVVLVLFTLSLLLVQSRFGRGLRAMGAHQAAASSLGVPVVRYRVQIFMLSAVYAAIAGGLYAHLLNYANGSFFDLNLMVQLMAMLVVGGIGTRWGPLVGALALTAVAQSLGHYADYSLLIFGVLYGAALLFLPQGICGEVSKWIQRRQNGHRPKVIITELQS